MKYFLLFLFALVLAFFFLRWSAQKDDYIMKVGDCVMAKMEADHFGGTLKQGWNTYADNCK